MPRIRTIKPEFCTSGQVADCSTSARLLFVLLWMFCDDRGVHPYNLRQIKMRVFPADNFSQNEMQEMISELIDAKLLRVFVDGGDEYLHVTGWKHQKIDRPSYKYPAPPVDDKFDEHSTKTQRAFVEDSPSDSRELVERHPPERRGKESKVGERGECEGREGKSTSDNITLSADGWQGITAERLALWRKSYPRVDIARELNAARAWIDANPKRAKKNYARFLANWLAKEQRGNFSASLRQQPDDEASWFEGAI